MKRYYNQKSFTLAEVLITLSIVGVVAALTIPGLITNFQKKIYINQLKDSYAIATEGFRRMLADDQVSDLEGTELYSVLEDNGKNTDVETAEIAIQSIILKYFNNAKIVKRKDVASERDCTKLLGTGTAYRKLGDKSKCQSNINPVYVFPNGAQMNLYLFTPCTQSSLSESETRAKGGSVWRRCGSVTLDVNGSKGPNQWGRDVFWFKIDQYGRLYPAYSKNDHIMTTSSHAWNQNVTINRCDPNNKNSNGDSCAGRIIDIDNWEMKY